MPADRHRVFSVGTFVVKGIANMQIKYSEKVKGNEQNYNWQVSFDLDSGFLGISQYHEDGKIERVLLSPKQKKALLEFCGYTKRIPNR